MSIAIVADKTADARVNSRAAAALISPLRENRTAAKAAHDHNGYSVRGKNLQTACRGVSNIRINAVSPGRIVTPTMLAWKIADLKAVAAGLPLRRMGQPEEVAAAVMWLAPHAASFIAGHNLAIDGGFLAG
jgi:NAD(P)-dependent dehydrogenase (short-subunit alcohol dehydrogenase family)